MKQEQFKDIQERLAKWREERGLSVEAQEANFYVNYTTELTEFFEAQRDNNEYEMIDALCDMVIVSMNAESIMGDTSDSSPFTLENLTTPLMWRRVSGLLFEMRRRRYDPYLCLLETIKELETRTGKWCEKEGKWIKDIGAYTEEEAWEKARAIDSKCVMVYRPNELLGAPEDTWGFDGNSSAIQVKKWYKADYRKCRIEE